MKLFETLTDENFELFAVRNYYNPVCVDAEEFYEDLKRFKYVKRLITRYVDGDTPPVNLILNHLVVIFNVYGTEAALKMLDYKIQSGHHRSIIKPFLIYLRRIDNTKYTGIPMDPTIVQELRNIECR
tara:strand:+ start:19 stop:399 length:381 start_codon:yes stop_codon:yes gene_type:complete